MNKNHIGRSYSLRFNHFLKTIPAFTFLLPVFFVLHGFVGNYGFIPAYDALLLCLTYIGISLVIAGLCWLLFHSWSKACLLSFSVMAYNFFFGPIQDTLKGWSNDGFVSQYRFILPASLLIFLMIIVWLKKRKKTLFTITSYLNILSLVVVLLDAGRLIANMNRSAEVSLLNPRTQDFVACDNCQKPDIYLVLLDQYAGCMALKEVFDFDNRQFETDLSRRGFHVVKDSRSNYNLTPFSMASLLNMDYLTSEAGEKGNLNLEYSYRLIKNSSVLQILTGNGYQFYNYSVFDFPGKPAHEYSEFLPYKTKLITVQTFIGRITRDIRSGILEGKFGFSNMRKEMAYKHLHFNDTIFDLTRKIATTQNSSPRFVYTHLILPHWPYYFDSKGNPVPIEKLSGFRKTNAEDYLEYLQYGNQKVLQLVDHILTNSPMPPIIMLMSDHGFRSPEKRTDTKYDFINLNAIYLPDKNYKDFYDGMSNTNQFRILFNSRFNQHFPLLKDSTINLWD